MGINGPWAVSLLLSSMWLASSSSHPAELAHAGEVCQLGVLRMVERGWGSAQEEVASELLNRGHL